MRSGMLLNASAHACRRQSKACVKDKQTKEMNKTDERRTEKNAIVERENSLNLLSFVRLKFARKTNLHATSKPVSLN